MRRCLFLLVGWLAMPGVVSAAETVDYLRDIKPIFKQRCFACHGALKQQAGLRLDSGELIRQGGESGPAVVPGNVGESLLLEKVTAGEGGRMPPEGAPLTEKQIALLKAWVEQGAKFPSTDQPETDPRKHWAFVKPQRPSLPTVDHGGWVRSAVDAFIAAEHQRQGLTPSPAADKATLLRRVYLDLIGLPPTREELHAFLADDSDGSYEKVVDRLLASPQYGERWARHWMDVWRYSDWYGRRSVPDVMNSYPTIWRWRDWIVRSLNQDKGYNRMLMEMLAADELFPDDDSSLVATGFIVRNWFKWNYNQWMRDQVEHTGKAFLGLTFNCAHCHDHKYDPITQEDYFRFRAFFEPLELRHDRVPGEPDPGPFQKYVYAKAYGPIASGMIRVFDEKLDAKTFLYVKGDERHRVKDRGPIEPGVPATLGTLPKIESVALPAAAFYPGLKPFVREESLAKPRQALAAADAAMAAARSAWAPQRQAFDNAVAEAESRLAQARKKAVERLSAAAPKDSRPRVLSGAQSLLLDATQGRRILGHKLAGLKPPKDKGGIDKTTVSFQLAILQDAHINFQLALDVDKGLTGAFVTFEKGGIRTYAPGTFNDVQVGRYNFTAGQNRFLVTFRRDAKGLYALSVKNLSDGRMLVDNAASDPHGWQPASDGVRGLFLDARPGAVALFDDIVFGQADGMAALRLDFESSQYADGKDIVGVEGWVTSSLGESPATSRIVSAISGDPEVVQAVNALRQVQSQSGTARLALAAAEAKREAAAAEISSIEARIAADTARYGATPIPAEQVAQRIRTAVQAEQQAKVAAARAAVAAAEQASPANAKQLEAANQVLTAAEAAQKTPPADYTPFSPVYPKTSTGRRRALAQWMASRDNPLTARVAVNHMWGWHFDRPLVDTTFNFGRSGKPPSHPALLDWLAVELMDSRWSMKHLHRLIVTSSAYRMQSHVDHEHTYSQRNAARDRDNHYLWRFNPARVEAEVVRDSVLHAAGELDLTLGGQEIDMGLGLSSRRRSLYFTHHGEEKMKFLELFDAANPCDCYERTTSITPQQALALGNGELTLVHGRTLARKLWRRLRSEKPSAGSDETAFIVAAFEQVLTRGPTDQELAASRRFLEKQRVLLQGASAPDPAAKARQGLVQALFSHGDFVTLR
jgi:mono/diheme cytochrome c family protein